MAENATRNYLIWGTVLILFGFLFLLDNFGIMDFGYFIRTFWPLILVIIGIKIIMDKRRGGPVKDEKNNSGSINEPVRSSGTFSESNLFGDIRLKSDSQKFTGGSVSNVFGDIHIDLANVQLDQGAIRLYISGVFGDLTVIMPENISYRVKASAVAGDLMVFGNKREGVIPSLEHQSENYETSSSKLNLQTSIVFGSVNIISE